MYIRCWWLRIQFDIDMNLFNRWFVNICTWVLNIHLLLWFFDMHLIVELAQRLLNMILAALIRRLNYLRRFI